MAERLGTMFGASNLTSESRAFLTSVWGRDRILKQAPEAQGHGVDQITVTPPAPSNSVRSHAGPNKPLGAHL